MSTEHTLLHENKWLSLYEVRKPEQGCNGYVYSHETRCKGVIVAVLPFRVQRSLRGPFDSSAQVEYLLRSEVTPCWGFAPIKSAITGGWEGGDVEDDVVREMQEETGYKVERTELISLGKSFASNSSDTVYSLFSVDLTGKTPGVPLGDGSEMEEQGSAVWVSAGELATIWDPQVAVIYLRLMKVFGALP